MKNIYQQAEKLQRGGQGSLRESSKVSCVSLFAANCRGAALNAQKGADVKQDYALLPLLLTDFTPPNKLTSLTGQKKGCRWQPFFC